MIKTFVLGYNGNQIRIVIDDRDITLYSNEGVLNNKFQHKVTSTVNHITWLYLEHSIFHFWICPEVSYHAPLKCGVSYDGRLYMFKNKKEKERFIKTTSSWI